MKKEEENPSKNTDLPFDIWLCFTCRSADPHNLAVAALSRHGECECCMKPATLYRYRITDVSI